MEKARGQTARSAANSWHTFGFGPARTPYCGHSDPSNSAFRRVAVLTWPRTAAAAPLRFCSAPVTPKSRLKGSRPSPAKTPNRASVQRAEDAPCRRSRLVDPDPLSPRGLGQVGRRSRGSGHGWQYCRNGSDSTSNHAFHGRSHIVLANAAVFGAALRCNWSRPSRSRRPAPAPHCSGPRCRTWRLPGTEVSPAPLGRTARRAP